MAATVVNPSWNEAKQRILALDLPDGVRFQQAFFAEDHSGDEAIYALFVVSKKFGSTSAKIRELNMLRARVGEILTEQYPDRLNYVRFLDGR